MADFPISGSIDPQTFPFLLTDLHRNGATGSLKVEGPTYQKALYFRGGRVLFGSSNDPRDQLGAILIENGRITPEQLEDVNSKVGPGRPLAKVLSESGLVSQQELSEAAQIKVERILWDIITYTGGSFEFEDGVLPKGAVDLKLSTERLILAAVRRVTDRSFVLRHLGSLEVILRPTAELAARLHEVQSDAGGLAEQIDGGRTLRDAASQTRLDEFDAAKVACGLLILGLVEKTGEVAPMASSGDEAAPFVIPDAEDGSPSIDLADTARGSLATDEEGPADSPFFVPETFAPPPAPPAFEPEPEPEPEPQIEEPVIQEPEVADSPTVMLDSPPPLFAPEPPPAAKPASSPGMLPLIPPPPRRPDPPQWTPPPPAPEDEEAPAAAPPSKEDLAALDALLNPRSAPQPAPEPQEKPGWEPRFSTSLAGGGRREPGGGSRLKPVLLGLLGLIVLAAAGGAYYVFFMQPKPGAAAQTPARPATAAPTAVAAATTPNAAAGTPTAEAPAGTPAKGTSVPATATAAATAAPTSARTSAPTAAPTAAATKAPAAASSGGGIAEARAMLRGGQYGAAAGAFAAHLRRSPNGFTVQLLVACSEETIKKAVTQVGRDELYVVPVDHKGKSCYKMGWGLYDNEASAASAMKALPDYFRQPGVTPRVVPAATVLR